MEEDSTVTPNSPTLWRRVAASSWGEPTSPVVYARLQLDVTDAIEKLKQLSEQSGQKVTLTALTTWAVAKAIAENPDANAVVRAGELKQLPEVNINVGIALDENDSVWPSKISCADKLDLPSIATTIKKNTEHVKSKQGAKLSKYGFVDWLMPTSIVRFFLNTFTVLETDWGFNLSYLGVDNVPYQPASATITCIHRFGLEEAFATFPTIQPTPIVVTVGKVAEKPWVVDGVVKPRKVLVLNFTVDHRVLDGKLGGAIIASVKKHFLRFSTQANHSLSKL